MSIAPKIGDTVMQKLHNDKGAIVMKEVTLDLPTAKALALLGKHICPKKDIRPQVKCVAIARRGSTHYLVATDGAVLVQLYAGVITSSLPDGDALLVPMELAQKASGAKEQAIIVDDGTALITLSHSGTTYSAPSEKELPFVPFERVHDHQSTLDCRTPCAPRLDPSILGRLCTVADGLRKGCMLTFCSPAGDDRVSARGTIRHWAEGDLLGTFTVMGMREKSYG